MSATIMDGNALARLVKTRVREEVDTLPRKPGLAVILVGENPASAVYVKNKEKDCEECGFVCTNLHLPETTSEEELLALVRELNAKTDVDGILVQLPLPKQIHEKAVLKVIDPSKDVDAFHPENVGKILQGDAVLKPCTPAGIIKLLDYYRIPLEGKKCVVIGRSNIVGKPMAILLLEKNATVTMCHSHTENLKAECLQADVIVSAAGKAGLVTKDMVKRGAAVIDVSMNRNSDGKFCGDAVFEEVKEVAAYITPVPGGVGPMTRAMLMENTLRAAKRHMSH